MKAEDIISDAELWVAAYLGGVINYPRKQSLILGYVMGMGISQVAKLEVIDILVKREKTSYHSVTG